MANTVNLTQVEISSAVSNNAHVIIEDNNKLKRYNLDDIGDISINLADSNNQNYGNGINADTLNGKREWDLSVANAQTLNNKFEDELSVANAQKLGHYDASEYALKSETTNEIKKLKDKTPFAFGVDENGNYGYIKAGADSVTPFNKGQAKLLATFSGGVGQTYPYEFSYQFKENYSQALIVIFSCDTDNNSDNFYKVYSNQNSAIATSSYGSYWNMTIGEWDYFKPIPPIGTDYPAANNNYTTNKDRNKDLHWATGTSNAVNYACVAYKNDIKKNDTAWMYVNFYRRGIVFVFGIK